MSDWSMKNRGVYGKTLGEVFRLEQAPTFTSRTLRNVEIGVTHITCNIENNGMTSPLPTDDAYLVTVQLVPCESHELWIDGKPRKTGPLVPGSVSIYDLRQTPIVNSISTFENLHFYLPRSALLAVAQGKRPRQPNEIDFEPGVGVVDPVLHQLARSLLPSFGRPERTVSLFVDHVTTAVAAYVADRYISGDADLDESVPLSDWQLRRAQEMLSNAEEEPSIAALALECGVDSGAFSKSFAASTGALPHVWRRDLKVERAKGMLSQSDGPLEDVVKAAGFGDNSELQREFLETVGITPEGWRHRA
jgi:AraC-like DNA-binding protein